MKLNHIVVDYREPHFERTGKILKAHPEVSELFGNVPWTSFFVFGIVFLQLAVMASLAGAPWWAIALAAYTVGAFANHALWVLIHECTHNLVFKTSAGNSLLQIFANLPIIFPSAISFRVYHIKHHMYQGDFERDADLPREFEARLVGNTFFGKATWLLFFFVSQLGRVPFVKGVQFLNPWMALNIVVEVGFLAGVVHFLGWGAFAYLALASIFSIGLHPLGARWIQEHYVVHEKQETYSYYGPLNKVAFNVGFHNEHHDMMRVPWTNLPKVRALAPEFYDTLFWHKSWTKLWLQFLFDPKLSLFSRVVRSPEVASGQAGLSENAIKVRAEREARKAAREAAATAPAV